MQDTFRISDAAEVLDVHPSHLYRLIRAGVLKPKKKHPLSLSRSTLREYIEDRFVFISYLFPEISKKN